MDISKNIIEIIQVQNSCKSIIQELYSYNSRPNNTLRGDAKNAKTDEAIRLNIIEYDSFDDTPMLSSDTHEYYQTKLGQNDDTNIGLINNKLSKLKMQLTNHNLRVKNLEPADRELKKYIQNS